MGVCVCVSLYTLDAMNMVSGLDIGEVDLIIMYDALKSPVRMVQRMGRTGRRRDGRVVVLLTEGAEVTRYLAGNQSSTMIKNSLRTGKFKMYRRSAKILPNDIGPVKCRRVHLSISKVTLHVDRHVELPVRGNNENQNRETIFFPLPRTKYNRRQKVYDHHGSDHSQQRDIYIFFFGSIGLRGCICMWHDISRCLVDRDGNGNGRLWRESYAELVSPPTTMTLPQISVGCPVRDVCVRL